MLFSRQYMLDVNMYSGNLKISLRLESANFIVQDFYLANNIVNVGISGQHDPFSGIFKVLTAENGN